MHGGQKAQARKAPETLSTAPGQGCLAVHYEGLLQILPICPSLESNPVDFRE